MSTSTKTKLHMNIRALCEGALMVAAAQVLGYLKLFGSLSAGGSITFAMFPICFYAARWGLGKGLLTAFAFGLLQLLLDGAYTWGWESIILDYLLGFGALGLAGVFHKKSWGIFPGIVLGCLVRLTCGFTSGLLLLYGNFEPTALPVFGTIGNVTLYSFLYNASYIIPCMILALAVAGVLYKPLNKYFTGQDLK